MPAVPIHHTPTTDAAWDGPGQIAKIADDATTNDFAELFAWEPASLDDRKSKSNWKFPHHEVGADGKPGDANVAGCQAVIGVLNGAMGGTNIPDADRKGVWDHVAEHLKDAGETPAELKAFATGGIVASGSSPVIIGGRGHESLIPASASTHTTTEASRMSTTDVRTGGYRGAMSVHRDRFLAGDTFAARALYLDAVRVQALNTPFHQVEIRAKPDGTGGTRLLFTGYASVTENPYEMQDWLGPYNEIVRAGAFTKTLSEKPDTNFLVNHGGITMARTKSGSLRLSEDDTGLYTEADLDPARSDVGIIRSAIEGGELDEMSFAFWITRCLWSPDYTQFDILEVSLDHGDVSVVNFGANPHTAGLVGLRSRQLANLARSAFPGLVRDVYHQRTGQNLAAGELGSLLHILGLATGTDDSPEETRAVLASIVGGLAPAAGDRPGAEAAARAQSADPTAPAPDADRETLRCWVADRAAQVREGKALSADTMSTLADVLDLIAAADVAVDAAQPLLAGLMGVPNPDAEEQDAAADPDDVNPDDEGEISSAGQANSLPVELYQRQLEALCLAAPIARP